MLQGMPYSPVKFTGASDAQCLQGMPYSPENFAGAPDAQCLQECHHPQTILPGAHGMLCTTRILKAVYHICSEMYHEVISLLQTVHTNGMLCTALLE